MSSSVARRALPLAALATAVLVTGVAVAASLPEAAESARAAAPSPSPTPSVSPSPSPQPAPVAVPLSVRPVAAPAVAYSPGNPATWSSHQLAAQLVFSCVQSSDLGTAMGHARAGLGGVAVMGRPTDRAGLTAGLAAVKAGASHGIAPLLASDEEGGRVQRLKSLLGPLPSAAVMGTWPDAKIEQTAHAYGLGMRSIGVQLALSPVADLAAAGGYPAETQRAFSADPRRAAGAAVAWSGGLKRAGVLSAVKHWPGHGRATDSHTAAPAVPPLAALEGSDLLPFDAVLRSGASIVMVGHLRSSGLTEPGVPATLSPNAMKVLRKRSGPAMVILTDSVSMAASSSALGITPPAAAVRALQAGADWAMSCVDPLGAVAAIQAAIDDKRLPRAAAVASAHRILAVKHKHGLLKVAPATSVPTGTLEAASLTRNVVTITGRTSDPDTPAPPTVRVLVDGVQKREVLATAGTGAFRIGLPVATGSEVCLLALNTGRGAPTRLGCVTRP